MDIQPLHTKIEKTIQSSYGIIVLSSCWNIIRGIRTASPTYIASDRMGKSSGTPKSLTLTHFIPASALMKMV